MRSPLDAVRVPTLTLDRVKLPKSFLAVNVSETYVNGPEQGEARTDNNM